HSLSAPGAALRALLGGAVAAAIWTALARSARPGGRGSALPVLGALLAAAGALLFCGRCLTLAEGAAALAVAVGVTALLGRLAGGAAIPAAAAAPIALAFSGLL